MKNQDMAIATQLVNVVVVVVISIATICIGPQKHMLEFAVSCIHPSQWPNSREELH